jgi:hypothetical protein
MPNMIRFALSLLPCLLLHSAQAQLFTYPPTGVTTTAGEFNLVTPVTNLIYDITPDVRSTTPFVYETTSQFNTYEVGYIAQWNMFTGTISFDMPAPVTVERVYLWNAYFTIEADHSVQDVVFHFYDQNNTLLSSVAHSWPMANIAIQTGDSLILPDEIDNVMRVDVEVQTLHGGNDISLRRIAFAGPTFITGLDEVHTVPVQAFPNPARDRVTLMVRDVREVVVRDAAGRAVHAPLTRAADRVELDVAHLAPGRYHVRVATEAGTRLVPLVVTH